MLQLRNNYDLEVYNGDIGEIVGIDAIDQLLTVRYDNERDVAYDFGLLDELTLAYAISIHKAQGAEYACVVIPLLTQHYTLLQRNLLYTGVTRAKRLVVLLGDRRAIAIAVKNNRVAARYTGLMRRLKGGYDPRSHTKIHKYKRDFVGGPSWISHPQAVTPPIFARRTYANKRTMHV